MKKIFTLFSIVAFTQVAVAQWTGTSISSLTTRNGNVVIGNSTLEGSYGTNNRVLQMKAGVTWLSMLSTNNSSFNLGHSSVWGTALYSRAAHISFWTSPTSAGGLGERMRIATNGNVGIGTKNPTSPLTVNGKIEAEEIEVKDIGADYVFQSDYTLLPLNEVEEFITHHKHLPGIPPASETEKGVELGAFSEKLLQKIEELTLYVIDLKKENEELQGEIRVLKDVNSKTKR